MPKIFIMYNLKDELKEEDFVKWVHEFKGPFISGLSAVKSYTLTRVQDAVKSEGGPRGPAEPPYRLIGIVDVTSFEDYAKDQETRPFKEDFSPKMNSWVKNIMVLRAGEIFPAP
ncbi:MAG: hypothetical protein JRJ85_00185 [Deltaproteobacteria bacterium]|nr:hypothetical protein [Deltaproteobacteria bacterium]